MSYSELQNGSDIRGIALENETGEKVNLTEKSAQDIAGAFIRWLSAKTGIPLEFILFMFEFISSIFLVSGKYSYPDEIVSAFSKI